MSSRSPLSLADAVALLIEALYRALAAWIASRADNAPVHPAALAAIASDPDRAENLDCAVDAGSGEARPPRALVKHGDCIAVEGQDLLVAAVGAEGGRRDRSGAGECYRVSAGGSRWRLGARGEGVASRERRRESKISWRFDGAESCPFCYDIVTS